MQDSEIKKKYRDIYRQILTAHRKYHLNIIWQNSLYFLSISLAAIILFLLLNLIFEVVPAIRWIFIGAFAAWFLIFTFIKILPKLKEIFSPSNDQILASARRIGMTDDQVKDALIDYLEIFQDRSSSGSVVLKNMALEQLYQRFSQFYFKRASATKKLGNSIRPLVALAVIPVVLYIFLPVPFDLALKKMVFPWKSFEEPLPVQLANTSGYLKVLKNDPVTFSGEYTGIRPEKLFLIIEDTLEQNAAAEKPQKERIVISVPQTNNFKYTLDHVRHSFKYYFLAEISQPRFRERPAVSPPGIVQVRERPVIRNLQVKVVPPKYSGLPAQLLAPNDGEITALRGSEASLHVEADKQLSHAFILLDDSVRKDLEVAGHTANGSLSIMKNATYTIHIFDSDSIDNSEPVEYSIFPLADEYPYAEIKQPGANVDLGDELQVPVFVELRDDYGFSGLWLKGQVIHQGSTGDTSDFKMKLPYKILEKGKAYHESTWDLTSFYLIPDDFLQYHVEVWDNDRVSGPKAYRTGDYTIRFPSLMDFMDVAEQSQEEQLEKVKDISKESKEVKEKLEELRRELMKENEVDWEKKQDIKEQLDKQKKAMDKLSQVHKELEDVIQKLDDRKMLNPETLEKYFELQKMFQDLATPEMKEAMEKLQKALEKANPEQIRKAMEKFQLSMEQFEKSIERTYELFKRVQLEQKMDELVNLAAKIAEEQEKVNKELQKSDTHSDVMNRLERKEESLQRNTEQLKDKIGDTQKDYQELMKELSEMLQKSEAFMDKEKISEAMQQMRQQMNSGDRQSAGKSGKGIKSQMDMLQNMLQMARNQMAEKQKTEIAQQMQKSMQDILSTSFEQEDLVNRSQKSNAASSQINQIARRQSQLQESTRQIVRQLMHISNKTFFLSPQLNQMMSNIVENMRKSIGYLENRSPQQAANAQQQAMGGFNQVLLSMQNSMEQMSQASSASGFQEFMKSLQQMSGQQGQLNQETMSLLQQGQQGRMQLSADDMARLAAQQEMIRKSMEELTEEAGNRRDVLGRMGELGDEMGEVVKELKAQRLDRKVIERQERILSRLLDAQKSIREKEYSKKREAEREKQVLAKSPPALRQEMLQKEDRLRRELMQALEEGYTPEYRELIKQYFEELSRQPVKDK